MQARKDFFEMRAVTRFDRAKNVYGGDIGTGESAIVHHFFDARADRRDLRGEIGEAARPIANYCRKTRKSPVRHEPALDHPAEHVWIDVAAAEQEDDTLAREFGKLPGEAGCEGRRGGAFDYAFFQFDDAQDRERDLFLVHEHDLVGVLARDLERVAPTWAMASPSAKVGCVSMRTGFPARSAAEKLAT